MVTVALLALLVAAPALASLLSARSSSLVRRALPWKKFQPGLPIVYRLTETPTCGTRAAREIHPAGRVYDHGTHKYWLVEEVRADGLIVARSALMEQYFLQPDDPNLRKATLLERLRHGARFPYPA